VLNVNGIVHVFQHNSRHGTACVIFICAQHIVFILAQDIVYYHLCEIQSNLKHDSAFADNPVWNPTQSIFGSALKQDMAAFSQTPQMPRASRGMQAPVTQRIHVNNESLPSADLDEIHRAIRRSVGICE
jgi:hypothetical protein